MRKKSNGLAHSIFIELLAKMFFIAEPTFQTPFLRTVQTLDVPNTQIDSEINSFYVNY